MESNYFDDDTLLIFLGYSIVTFTAFVASFLSKRKVRAILTHLLAIIIYSCIYKLNLIYAGRGSGGSALVWFFYLLLFISAHIVVNISILVFKLIEKWKVKKLL